MIVVSSVFKRTCKLMGNRFELSAVADSEQWANEKIDAGIAEIQRIERAANKEVADIFAETADFFNRSRVDDNHGD